MAPRFIPQSTLTRISFISAFVAAVACNGALAQSDDGAQEGTGFFPLWEPFAPPENQTTETKRVLGKILFWDEQLSSDNTVSCGTCHIPSAGGSDPRDGLNPAFDGIFGTDDDVEGSAGLILTDANDEYLRSVLFEMLPQTTPRRSMTNLISMYAGNLFWDGRAEGDFVDPETGQTIAVSSTGLEIQALGPILNDVEMSHQDRDWATVTSKIAGAKPLALASDIPQDMLDAINANDSYPALFELAFGDSAITATRIAFAIATYQRTLVPNQSPWDQWVDGVPGAMSPEQLEGFELFRATTCNDCHVAPLFTTMAFTVNGVRPIEEDSGRFVVTGTNQERGAFRMASLRNLAGRDRFMHTGGLTTMDDVFDFYAHRNGQGPVFNNLDGRLFSPIVMTPQTQAKVEHFILTGLTDPRTINETFPFDRPTLHTELGTANPEILAGGNAGTGGFIPKMIAITPPNIGNLGFKVGLDMALGGAQAWVAISSSAPKGGIVAQDQLVGPIDLNGMSAGDGYGTVLYPIDDPALDNQTFYMQWIVADPSAVGGFARSDIAAVTPFCSMIASCAPACAADLNNDGEINFFDVSVFLSAYNAMDPIADFDNNGSFNFFDVSDFLGAFAAGCP